MNGPLLTCVENDFCLANGTVRHEYGWKCFQPNIHKMIVLQVVKYYNANVILHTQHTACALLCFVVVWYALF